MKHIVITVICLFFICTTMIPAQEQYKPARITIKPVVDLPIGQDANLFKLSGGGAVSGSYIVPEGQAFSVGAAVNYHLGRMNSVDLGDLGSLSTISIEATAEIRGALGGLVELYLTGFGGYFHAFRNHDPSQSAANYVFGAGAGFGIVVDTTLTLGIYGEYRNYATLYQLAAIGIQIDFRIGGNE